LILRQYRFAVERRILRVPAGGAEAGFFAQLAPASNPEGLRRFPRVPQGLEACGVHREAYGRRITNPAVVEHGHRQGGAGWADDP